jgi:hypothetical protein
MLPYRNVVIAKDLVHREFTEGLKKDLVLKLDQPIAIESLRRRIHMGPPLFELSAKALDRWLLSSQQRDEKGRVRTWQLAEFITQVVSKEQA